MKGLEKRLVVFVELSSLIILVKKKFKTSPVNNNNRIEILINVLAQLDIVV